MLPAEVAAKVAEWFLPFQAQRVAEWKAEKQDRGWHWADNQMRMRVEPHGSGLALTQERGSWGYAELLPTGDWFLTGWGAADKTVDGPMLLSARYQHPERNDDWAELISKFESFLSSLDFENGMSEVYRRVPGVAIEFAGGSVPFQAEGTLHGLPFYFRYRGGWMSLKLFQADMAEDDRFWAPLYLSGMARGDQYDGSLTRQEFCEVFPQMVAQLERAPRSWSFTGTRVEAEPDRVTEDLKDVTGKVVIEGGKLISGEPVGAATERSAWGMTPDEAWTRIHENPVPDLLADQDWASQVAALGLNPQTVTVDERVWPDPEPVFTVLD